MDVKPEDIETLVAAFDGSTWDEVRVKLGTVEIHLAKDPAARDRAGGTVVEMRNGALDVPALAPAPETPAAPAARNGAVAKPAVPAPAGEIAPAEAEGKVVVRAPNFGTFYRSPKPGAPPYVEVGQRVDPKTEICLIEVMKLFTPVRAGVAGIVRGALVKDSAMVEFDQPLFLVEPD